jgi:sugar O-acyltransferase (sialic acid O-acetyltransferase NeuD family)
MPAHTPQPIIILGGGGQGKTLIDLLRLLDGYTIAGIVDEGLPTGAQVMGVPVLGGNARLPELRAQGIALALNAVGGIGNVDVRLRVFDLLKAAGFAFPTVVHPSACVEHSAELEDGVQVGALTYIGSLARVGFGTLINSHVCVSHDCRIGQVVNLSPGALLAGGVRVEDYAQIGMGATVNINLTVGARARVGNGATVKADVPAGGRVFAGSIWPPRAL